MKPVVNKRMFGSKRVSAFLPFSAPLLDAQTDVLYELNRGRLSISGVQDKFSMLLDGKQLRLTEEGKYGVYILKPVPRVGKNSAQMPANEHLTMQLARQVFGIETAENTLIFFKDGSPAYLTKRFDIKPDGTRWAQEDFASLAGLRPQTHGENYKYTGAYLDLFILLKKYVPAYMVEAPKLLRLLLFNYLFSNGDAHFKNFSLLETPLGDFRLSPAYDLLNSRIHSSDRDFALEHGLLPPQQRKGKVRAQFQELGRLAGIPEPIITQILTDSCSHSEKVLLLIEQSFLSPRFKRNYTQAYQTRLAKLLR
jgi:serine/threonine-protein kinase HipA